MTFAFDLAQAKAIDILSVAQRYSRLKRYGNECVGPCPVCGGRDRFSVNMRKAVFNCRGCGKGGDVVDLVQHVDGVGLLDAVRNLTGQKSEPIRHPIARAPAPPPPDATSTSDALAVWRAGGEPRSSVVERYLNSRGLELDEGLAGEVIRFHAATNAMLALFRGIEDDQPKAISRTFLYKDGVKLGRKFLGPVGGCAIKLDPEEEVLSGLHIGEGIETCMSARQLGLRPTWALGSAGAIAAFPMLPAMECLTFLRERDEANERAATKCALRWREAKREVRNAWPDEGGDLNDEIRGA